MTRLIRLGAVVGHLIAIGPLALWLAVATGPVLASLGQGSEGGFVLAVSAFTAVLLALALSIVVAGGVGLALWLRRGSWQLLAGFDGIAVAACLTALLAIGSDASSPWLVWVVAYLVVLLASGCALLLTRRTGTGLGLEA